MGCLAVSSKIQGFLKPSCTKSVHLAVLGGVVHSSIFSTENIFRGISMARFTGGWVKLWRKAVLGDIGSNYTRSGLFQTLLVIANVQESTVSWGGKPRKLERGEIVTSIEELAELGEVDRRTVDRHLNYLANRGTVILEKRPFGTFIKIVNYSQYQDVDAEHAKPERNDTLNLLPNHTPNHVAHIEELKNIRKKEVKKVNNKISANAEVPDKQALKTNHVIAHYCNLWKAKYGGKCDVLGHDAGILKRVVKSLGGPRTILLLDAYFEMPDVWYAKNRHDLITFEKQIKQVGHYADTGAFVNRKKISEAEETQHFQTKYQASPEDDAKLSAILAKGENKNLLPDGTND